MRIVSILALLALTSGSATAAVYQIGDNDGYGAGICDNCSHTFDGFTADYDGRSAAEKLATDGAQYTDTYSTTQPGYSPHGLETVATFHFSGLGTHWTFGKLEIDVADFQASEFGAVAAAFNGISQDFAFNDGYTKTAIHSFVLSDAVLNSINATGELIVTIDRNNSSDFYGIDYLRLTDFTEPAMFMPPITHTAALPVPEPETYLMLLAGLALLSFAYRRNLKPIGLTA
ncbi:PEP-CTERM sorting domain-containing protein [Nitrosomonas sp.]|uniref:PEP-CTERM sorting domain-containing protein n=1 Tax=Nitrosomonas sp. TaxID=42353 RepID=UPI001DFED07E|nr:PEP-CTERM sorting domain-containing protein [Nitrosomonas sp.]MBX3615922.1 PEP-CTERM sorting domain-containing protein [Nitrosomonas sp.]